ncbi:hypothetical protein M0811_10048 [Anaeramoeba ignava]|uniref:RING-type domain-containing protein n=1 Tax=Anaeramoeba ignava TaxID=1746090 RepID=A0A9Q0RAE4_ANAIG|nr:hypothetical protein M0811_10048 [Anaeramoeba ignava]
MLDSGVWNVILLFICLFLLFWLIRLGKRVAFLFSVTFSLSTNQITLYDNFGDDFPFVPLFSKEQFAQLQRQKELNSNNNDPNRLVQKVVTPLSFIESTLSLVMKKKKIKKTLDSKLKKSIPRSRSRSKSKSKSTKNPIKKSNKKIDENLESLKDLTNNNNNLNNDNNNNNNNNNNLNSDNNNNNNNNNDNNNNNNNNNDLNNFQRLHSIQVKFNIKFVSKNIKIQLFWGLNIKTLEESLFKFFEKQSQQKIQNNEMNQIFKKSNELKIKNILDSEIDKDDKQMFLTRDAFLFCSEMKTIEYIPEKVEYSSEFFPIKYFENFQFRFRSRLSQYYPLAIIFQPSDQYFYSPKKKKKDEFFENYQNDLNQQISIQEIEKNSNGKNSNQTISNGKNSNGKNSNGKNSNQINSNQINSNQINSNQINSNQTNSNQTISNQTISNQTNSNQIFSNQKISMEFHDSEFTKSEALELDLTSTNETSTSSEFDSSFFENSFFPNPQKHEAKKILRFIDKQKESIQETKYEIVLVHFPNESLNPVIIKQVIVTGSNIFSTGDVYGNDEVDVSECVICLENRRNVVLIPCRHMCVCQKCLHHIDKCPICRAHFTSHLLFD